MYHEKSSIQYLLISSCSFEICVKFQIEARFILSDSLGGVVSQKTWQGIADCFARAKCLVLAIAYVRPDISPLYQAIPFRSPLSKGCCYYFVQYSILDPFGVLSRAVNTNSVTNSQSNLLIIHG